MALITCPECNKQISDTSNACPNCGYDLKAAKRAKAVKGCGIGCLAIIAIGLIIGLITGDKDSSSTGGRPRRGEAGTLRVPGGGDVPVAISQQASDRFTQLSVAKDRAGVGQMILAGLVWTVPSGTKCHVIDSGVFTYEVRISEGTHAGRACFVASDFVARK